jgi:diguanylate cyclase (GGDEF)-like protein
MHTPGDVTEEPLAVALVESDRPTARMLEVVLSGWGYAVAVAGDEQEAWALLQSHSPPPLAIIEWSRWGFDGLQFCRDLRRAEGGDEAGLYLILISTQSSHGDLMAGMDAGADDYVVKPFDPTDLRLRLRAGERIVRLQRQVEAAVLALHDQTTHDDLTGAWNRGSILQMLDEEVNRSRRDRASLAVLMADLDGFKTVNDTHGHQVGDQVLREAALRLTTTVRGYDRVGRYGGDEFLLVLPGCSAEGAVGLGERLREAVKGNPIALPEGEVTVTLSVGVACLTHRRLIDAQDLIGRADAALYEAKRSGRDRVCVMLHPERRSSARIGSGVGQVA